MHPTAVPRRTTRAKEADLTFERAMTQSAAFVGTQSFITLLDWPDLATALANGLLTFTMAMCRSGDIERF